MGVNKVVMNTPNGEQTLIDLTNDTVTPETLAEDVTAHDASGNVIRGVMPMATVLYTAQTLTEAQKAQARQNIGAQAELTDADKESIVQDVITALGTPVFGRVDEDCKITLSGTLADGKTYTFVYEDEDGKENLIGTYTKTAQIINLITTSVGSDGLPYNGGLGYKNGCRISTSSGYSEKEDSLYSLTGYIPIVDGNLKTKYYCENIFSNSTNNVTITLYDENFNLLEGNDNWRVILHHFKTSSATLLANNGVTFADGDTIELLSFSPNVCANWLGTVAYNAKYFRLVSYGNMDSSAVTFSGETVTG